MAIVEGFTDLPSSFELVDAPPPILIVDLAARGTKDPKRREVSSSGRNRCQPGDGGQTGCEFLHFSIFLKVYFFGLDYFLFLLSNFLKIRFPFHFREIL
jgi:hypothetical protein